MSLVTRQFGPNAKNSKLSFYDMDMNLYYLQELGVSGLSYSNNILTLTNPTGGTKSVNLNEVTAFTYNNLNTFLISDSEGNQFSAIIDEVSGLTVNGTLSATTYLNLPPASFTGGTVNGATSFINGLSANTISATTYQNLPQDVFVTGGTYTNGEILFRNNSGGTFTVTGLPIGGAGGQIYYFNLSESQSPYREFSPIGTNGVEQSTGITINSGVTDVISSFITPTGYPNALTIPAGYWSFYIHAYKDSINASFDVFCEVYTVTTGGTETLILSTEGADVQSVTPTVSMQLTDGYYSGKTIDVSDRILVKVLATNTGQQTNTITFFTEGQSHYSYGITPFSNFNALTCETLSGCTTIINLENNKVNKSGDVMTGTLEVPTISATTYQNLPVDPDTFITGFTYNNNTFTINQNNGQPNLTSTINSVTGLTVNGVLNVTGDTLLQGLTASTVNVTNTTGTPNQVTSFDSAGKLVAGAGQSTSSSFGSATLTVTNTTTTFTVLPGISQTITIPSNCFALITADGGVNTTSTSTTSISSVDIAIFIDGSFPTNGGYRRISAHNPSSTAVNSTGVPWSITTTATLSPGSHTIDVRAIYVAGSSMSVSSNNTNARQAALYITLIKL